MSISSVFFYSYKFIFYTNHPYQQIHILGTEVNSKLGASIGKYFGSQYASMINSKITFVCTTLTNSPDVVT